MKITISLINFLLFLTLTFNKAVAADFDAAIGKGDAISSSVFVTDKSGSQVHLQSLFQQAESGVNVLFIFGGGIDLCLLFFFREYLALPASEPVLFTCMTRAGQKTFLLNLSYTDWPTGLFGALLMQLCSFR